LTDDEITSFRAELTKIWKEESIDVYSLDDDHTPSSIRSGKKKILNTDNSLKRSFYRGRRPGEVLAVIARDGKYPWGNSCALDPEHSDLKLIRDSILSEHTERFLELATEKYCIYRDQQFARQRRSDLIKYAALFGLTAIQLRKVEMIRGVFSKVLSLIPVQRIPKLLLSRGIGNNTSSPLVEDNDDDNDDGRNAVMVSDDVSSSSSDRKSIFEFFRIPSFDSNINTKRNSNLK
jgi:septin family protein